MWFKCGAGSSDGGAGDGTAKAMILLLCCGVFCCLRLPLLLSLLLPLRLPLRLPLLLLLLSKGRGLLRPTADDMAVDAPDEVVVRAALPTAGLISDAGTDLC